MSWAVIKGQVLADFVAKFLPRAVSPKQGNLGKKAQEQSWLILNQMRHNQHKRKMSPSKKPFKVLEATNTEKIVEVSEVIIKPP